MEYAITMKQYNGSGYDSLFPKDVSQQVLLNNATVAELIGLSMDNPTILDAVSKVQTNLNWVADNYSVCGLGSYVGTGTYGVDHKNSLTFSFVPKFIIITNGTNYVIFINGSQTGYIIGGSGGSIYLTWDNTNKTVSWYSQDATNQMNFSNATYTYAVVS